MTAFSNVKIQAIIQILDDFITYWCRLFCHISANMWKMSTNLMILCGIMRFRDIRMFLNLMITNRLIRFGGIRMFLNRMIPREIIRFSDIRMLLNLINLCGIIIFRSILRSTTFLHWICICTWKDLYTVDVNIIMIVSCLTFTKSNSLMLCCVVTFSLFMSCSIL